MAGLRKNTFYSRTTEGCVKHEGWSDNQWNYYKNKDGDWWAIDPMTGLGLCTGVNRKNCIEKAHGIKIITAFNKLTKTDEYTKLCSTWYDMQVNAGIIMENPIH